MSNAERDLFIEVVFILYAAYLTYGTATLQLNLKGQRKHGFEDICATSFHQNKQLKRQRKAVFGLDDVTCSDKRRSFFGYVWFPCLLAGC